MAGGLIAAAAPLGGPPLRGPVTPASPSRSYRKHDGEHEQQQRGAGDEQVAQYERHRVSYAPAILGMGSTAFAISP